MTRDRRAALRRPIRWKAIILNSAGSLISHCTIVDVSSTGAMLVLPQPVALPEAFLLVLSRNGDVRRQCELSWIKEKRVGIRFLRPQPAEEEPVSHMSDALTRVTGHHGGGSKRAPA
jgi:PilZ domain-containing protein